MSNFPSEFMGLNDWVWWIGVVEYINDPTQNGRVKVRVFGFHSQDREKVPTDKLPWAYTVHPTTSAAFSGVGSSPTGLQVGSWVIGFFLDGRKGQFPAVFGTWHGIHATGSNPTATGKGPESQSPDLGGPAKVPAAGAGGFAEGNGTVARGDGTANWAPGPGNMTTITTQSGAKFTVSNNVAGNFQGFFNALESRGVYIDSKQSGGYNYRNIAGSSKLSQHSYGNAVDINWTKNAQGIPASRGFEGMSQQEISQIAADHGLTWGGNFSRPDNMHFSWSNRTGVPATNDVTKLPGYKAPSSNTNTTGTDTNQNEQTGGEGWDEDQTNNANQSHSSAADAQDDSVPHSPTKEAEVGGQHEHDEDGTVQGADGSKWGLPCPPDISSYPNQQTHRDAAGNIISMSSQPGGSRIGMIHGKSKSYMEMDDNGNTVQRAHGDSISHAGKNFRMSAQNHMEIATQKGAVRVRSPDKIVLESLGSMNIDAGRGLNLSGKGDMVLAIGGNLTIDAASIKLISGGGSIDLRSSGNINMESNGEMNISSKGAMAFETAANLFQKAHGDWTAHASGKGVLGADGDLSLKGKSKVKMEGKGDVSIKSEGKVKVEGSEYHNKSPKSIFAKGSFNELHATTLNWTKTMSTALYAESTAPAVQGSSTNFGAPAASDAADDPKDNITTRANELSQDANPGRTAGTKGEQVTGAGTAYGEKVSEQDGGKEKGGVARSAEANPIVPNPRPKPNDQQPDSNIEETPKPRPCYKDVKHQQNDSAPVQQGGDGGGDIDNGAGAGSSNDTSQASMGVAGVATAVKETPIIIPKLESSENDPKNQNKKQGEFRTDENDVKGLTQAAQMLGGMPKTVGAGAVMQKAMETGTKEAKIDEAKPHGSGKGSWFGQFGFGPYGAGQSAYVWRDGGDNGQNASGDKQTVPGIALPTRATLGKYYNVTAPNGKTLRLKHVDVGPRNEEFFKNFPSYDNPKNRRGQVSRAVDINAPAAEAFGYTPKNFPTDQGVFKYQLAQDQTAPAGFEYASRAKRVDTAARAYQAASGVRPSVAVAAGTSMYSPAVASAWGRAIAGGQGNRSINWLIKNSADKAIWQQFANQHRGKLHDPSYTLQELAGLWANNFGAPWKSLATSLIDLLPHGNGLNMDKLLSGIIPTDFSKIAQTIMSQMKNNNSGSSGNDVASSTTQPVANTQITSDQYEYNPSDGADATLTIKLMKALYGLDHTDETWDRSTFERYADNQLDVAKQIVTPIINIMGTYDDEPIEVANNSGILE